MTRLIAEWVIGFSSNLFSPVNIALEAHIANENRVVRVDRHVLMVCFSLCFVDDLVPVVRRDVVTGANFCEIS